MNDSKVFFGLLLIAHIVYAGVTLADTPADAGNGTITFRDASNGMCVTYMPEDGASQKYYLLGNDSGQCKDLIKTTRSWVLNELPSATVITLSSDPGCAVTNDQNVVITLRTTSKKVMTPIRELKVLGDYKINGFVNPGLQLLSRSVKPGSAITDSIACMIIKTSAKPPALTSSTTP